MEKKRNNKGFTLAELLIVVAIIAVLVAIAIPIFTNQLEKSREATDVANIRDYYAEISVALLNGELDYSKTTQTIKLVGGKEAKVTTALTTASGDFIISVSDVDVNQTVAEWQSGEQTVGGATIAANADMVGKTTVNYTFTVTAASATTTSTTYLKTVGFGA